ncbi:MAG: hypothetical protein DHS20C02_02940 [Micavibrio sp.]|nr:MAG: hypothetical protein DHS20C02_02940 [Micavibrio sp.]
MTMFVHREKILKFLLSIAVLANVLTWVYARDVQARWTNVPPVPNELGAAGFALGDKQFAYRALGLMLQNMGDTGGRSTALQDYNYEELTKWLFLMDQLDSESNYVPYLASYYFGSVQKPEMLRPMMDYFVAVGNTPYGEKWRWLAQGVYLARFRMNDLDKALEMAHVLAKIDNDQMPVWARQMPGFVLTAQGEKEAAYAIMVETLKSSADKLHPNEVNAMRAYICIRILDIEEARTHPLCQDIPEVQ